ncbi:hypothetical protein D9Q98_004093 [Chlorella vulgaris]|uniref:Uncharacterized protein n=1 Tax=Chlorella vulgaris TaxID=3077 RepID=A0A9D4TR93_CHLVU|nr:hypothetical protein D9Q98_004093 [Chlorella vulgaris]
MGDEILCTEYMRFVFPGSAERDFRDAMLGVFPEVQFKDILGKAPTAYIAFEDTLDLYEAKFPGIGVRVKGRLRHLDLSREEEALYLPVTYDSWMVYVDNPKSLWTALEAAKVLNVSTVWCHPFDADVPIRPSAPEYARQGDRVWRV